MYIQFVPELFIEVAELLRLTDALDTNGFRKALLENSVAFGLIKSDADSTFANGRVERDTDNQLGQKTVKIGALQGIDSQGQFVTSNAVANLPVPSDGEWHWIRVKHQFSSQEKGKVSIDAAGNLVGVGTEFTKILRGQGNFPTTLRFINASQNVLEYEVLEVTDDTHAVLVYPGINGGDSEFAAESNLFFQIVGTFTQGAAIDEDDKYPFKYDSAVIEVVPEVSANVRPSYVPGQEFYLARVSVQIGNLIIQDKRLDYWESKGSKLAIDISRTANPLIGVEAVKWENLYNPGDKNIVQLAWGMRSTNWSVDSSQNIVTIFGSSTGGSFKTTDDFTNGDFNGWRLYSANGKYRKIINSIKQGSAINLYLDILDVDDYSTDGGDTFTGAELFVAPNCDQVEIKCTADPDDSVANVNEIQSWPVNTPLAEILVTAYKDDTALVNIQYRYKSFKEFTDWRPIASGEYFTEESFTSDGNLKPVDDRVIYTYVSQPTAGFIQLKLSDQSLIKFKNRVYKGDIIGVQTLETLTAGQVLELKVGISDRYQYIKGSISLSDDVFISLSNENAVEGNEFTIHLNCTALNLGDKKIYIVDNLATGSPNIIKTISYADAFHMLNQEDGIAIRCTFDDTGHWIAYQNYDLGQPFELKMIDVPAEQLGNYFNTQSLAGKVRGYFGWALHSALNGGRVPVGFGTFTDDNGTITFVQQATGGSHKHKLVKDELPKVSLKMFASGNTGQPLSPDDIVSPGNADGGNLGYDMKKGSGTVTTGKTSEMGNDIPHNIMQPYYVTVYVKKTY